MGYWLIVLAPIYAPLVVAFIWWVSILGGEVGQDFRDDYVYQPDPMIAEWMRANHARQEC